MLVLKFIESAHENKIRTFCLTNAFLALIIAFIKRILFAILLVLLICLPCSAKVEINFTPSNDCEDSIIKYINSSEKTIDIAVYSINNDKIVEALKKAYDRGVKLRILTDKLQASAKSSKIIDLYKYGINIRVNSKHKIEHNKFAIYDRQVTSTGSFNWTNPASNKNSENCVFLVQDKNAVNKYCRRFEQLWNMNTKQKSDNWFRNRGI